MKKHIVFWCIAIGNLCLASCGNKDEIKNTFYPLSFDKSELIFESNAGLETVEILNAKEYWPANPEKGYGVSGVYTYMGKDSLWLPNAFVTEKSEGNAYNVYADPFAKEWFSIKKQGAKIIVELKENDGPERKLKVGISTVSPGGGEIYIVQKGKE